MCGTILHGYPDVSPRRFPPNILLGKSPRHFPVGISPSQFASPPAEVVHLHKKKVDTFNYQVNDHAAPKKTVQVYFERRGRITYRGWWFICWRKETHAKATYDIKWKKNRRIIYDSKIPYPQMCMLRWSQ